MNIKTAFDHFLAAKTCAKSPRTTRWYHDCLRPVINYLGEERQVENVTIYDLRAWFNHLLSTQKPELSPWTLNGYGRATRHFFSWLTNEGILEKNPAHRMEVYPLPKTPRRGICNSDRDAMLAAARSNPRDYAMLRFTAATGARKSGIAGLRMEDLELDARRAYVSEKGCGGNRKVRPVFFDDSTAAALEAWLKVRPENGSDLVFGLTQWGVYLVFHRLADRLKLQPGWYPHNWRHAFARNFIRKGGDLGTLSQLMGHTDVRVTKDFYGDLDDHELQVIYNRFSPFA